MPRFFVLVLSIAGSLNFGCSNDDAEEDDHQHHHGGEGGGDSSDLEGLRMCCEISAICHEVSEPSSEEADECHDIGHDKVPDACRSAYEGCLAACEGLNDDPVEHGCE